MSIFNKQFQELEQLNDSSVPEQLIPSKKTKKLPYWLKGALLFAVLFFPIFWAEGVGWVFLPLLIVWYVLGFQYITWVAYFIVVGGDPSAGGFTNQQRFTAFCIVLVLYIIIGGILGWVYGKIKNRHIKNA